MGKVYLIALVHFGCVPVQAGTLLAADNIVHVPDGNAVLAGELQFIFYDQRGTGIDNLPSPAIPHIGSRRGSHQKGDIGTGGFQLRYQIVHGGGMLGGVVAPPVCFVGSERQDDEVGMQVGYLSDMFRCGKLWQVAPFTPNMWYTTPLEPVSRAMPDVW